MILTARQLEDLHKSTGSNGHVTLPRQARLTPNAQDWLKQRRIEVGFVDGDAVNPRGTASAPETRSPGGASFLWWCDGPCGPAKAAIVTQSRESDLKELAIAQDRNHLVAAIKAIAAQVKSNQSAGAVLLVQNGANAVVFANRCPSLRAIIGTCIDAVDQGLGQVAANVLIIEHPYKTLSQVKNLVSRFVRGPSTVSDELKQQLSELTSCG
jgi:hypothetical protein